jgi:hypothetical protein
METYVVRVWLPDRPGALGQVASRIGAVRGDVVGIDILERGGGRVVDELVVNLPDDSLVDLLVAEMAHVDGVAVEDVRRVDPNRGDAEIRALELAAALAETAPDHCLDVLCMRLAELLEAEWAALFDTGTGRSRVEVGQAPDVPWLAAFVDGSRHLDSEAQAAGAPGEIAWAGLAGGNLVIALGRKSRPFHGRERQRITMLCRVAAALIGAATPA